MSDIELHPSQVTRPGSPSNSRDAWSRYWDSGVFHSCPGSYGEDYGGAIGHFWRDAFHHLATHARVLDIATGNGALPRLLLRRGADIQCDAIDLADINPSWLTAAGAADQERMRFHGRVDAARLPFADGCFDLVVSQYGIEYTELDKTLPELLRVRAPMGGVAMILHHSEGRPATLAKIEIDHLDWLTRNGGLFEAAIALVGPMIRARSARLRNVSLSEAHPENATESASRGKFNNLLRELSARAAIPDGADVLFEAQDAVMTILANSGNESEQSTASKLSALQLDFACSATRLKDLRDHALNPDAAKVLQERLATRTQKNVTLGELLEGKHLMGWTLLATAG